MSNTNIIDLSLFDLLTKVKNLFNTGDVDDFALRMNNVKDSLIEFIQALFIGFFRNGYGVNIDGVNDPGLEMINHYFRFKTSKPQCMINLYKEAKKEIAIARSATYDNPPEEEKLKEVFEIFIPNLLKSANEEFAKLNAVELSKKTEQVLADLWKQ
jgi:hypothetical protein